MASVPVNLPAIPFAVSSDANTEAVNIVNAYEPYFRSNMQAYQAGRESAQVGAAVFDALWARMAQILGTLGSAGAKALQDRQPGGQYPWESYYRPPAPASNTSVGTVLANSGVTAQQVSQASGIPVQQLVPPAQTVPVSPVSGGMSGYMLPLLVIAGGAFYLLKGRAK